MILRTPNETLDCGVALGARVAVGDVITLSGALGAGKTVLARGILRGLGYPGDVASPSFPLVIPYEPPLVRIPLYHVDLYRIDDPERIEELALGELRQDGVLVIEWPERLAAPLAGSLDLVMTVDADGVRALTAGVPEGWEARWPPRR